MDILSYTGKVKSFSEQELYAFMAGLQVSVNDLTSNLENIKANNLDGSFDKAAESWTLTKSILKYAADKGFRHSETLGTIQYGLSAIAFMLPGIDKLIKGYRTKIWDGQIATLRQANIMNLVEYINFWIDYSNKLVDVVLTIQLSQTDPNKYLSVHDQKWMLGTQDFYKQFTVELLKGGRLILQSLEKIPDVEVTDVSLGVLESTSGKKATDLLDRGFGIHNLNPVFWIGLGRKNINLARIENMRKRNQTHAMKISQAVNKRDGTNDPQIDHQIEIYQEKIIRNEAAIEAIIRDYD